MEDLGINKYICSAERRCPQAPASLHCTSNCFQHACACSTRSEQVSSFGWQLAKALHDYSFRACPKLPTLPSASVAAALSCSAIFANKHSGMDNFCLQAQSVPQYYQQAWRPVQHLPAHSCMKTQEKLAMSAMVYCPAASHSRPSLRCFSITPYNLLVSFVYLLTPYSIFSGAYLTKWFAWPCMGPRPPCRRQQNERFMLCCKNAAFLAASLVRDNVRTHKRCSCNKCVFYWTLCIRDASKAAHKRYA